MLQFKAIFLCGIFVIINLTTLNAQRITSNLKEGFKYVSVHGKKMIFYMLEDQRYALVTDGIPLESLDYEVEKDTLIINLPEDYNRTKNSLVLLYPKGNQVPRVLESSENVLVQL
ncbi:hypothetical protein [Croceitalea rosinachiae]|uniref:Uncharacterized protein n=1 Tax=Croceitalea rosinachiae TaxID=3075596 RepID=A0ABU3ACY6_9FLAO|nr:hypothetical protein [Croceitalea sp. F388]MDT0608044.1 hypothetical protein [Croceitalea sp. F388]